MNRTSHRHLLLVAPAFLLLLAFFVTPLAAALWNSFHGAAFDLSSYREAFSNPLYFHVFLRTLEVGAGVTAICLVLGYPIAYFMTTLSPRALAVCGFFVLVPLFTAFLIRTFGWMIILGRGGALNRLLLYLGVISTPLKITGTSTAVYVGMVHVLMPVAVFVLFAGMRQVDRTLLSAAQVLGANPVQAFLRVYVPMTIPAVISAGLLVFIMALGFYVTPVLLGGPADTMISQLIVTQVTTLLNLEFGYALSVILLAATVGVLTISNLFVPLEQMWSLQSHEGGKTRGWRSSQIVAGARRAALWIIEKAAQLLLGRPRWLARTLLRAYVVLAAIFLILPLIIIYILSFSSSPFLIFPPPGFSWQWYEKFFSDPDWQSALFMSLKLAAATATVSVVVGASSAFGLVRGTFAGKQVLLLFLIAPLLVPVVVVALSLYVSLSHLHLLGTFLGLVIGHMVITVPYAVVISVAAVRGLDVNLEHAASTLGAAQPVVQRRVVLPQLAPALGTAWILCFLTSLDELLITLFLLGRQTETLPIRMWSDIRIQVDPVMSAAASVIVTAVAVLIMTSQYRTLKAK
ncbi:MAG TPA: ABC transporter permease subunit [Steroidobacteraceae bacterium]|jgi:putative spermidine/putrescine transport system permease protein|nr:ABC transporter permease subunit [Steroidobacteraceae bacterium]